jgi:Malectin domain
VSFLSYAAHSSHTKVNSRIFDVAVEGQLLQDIDLVKDGGGVAFKALTRQFSPVDVRDGFLTVSFKRKAIDLPKISGIEVHQLSIASPIGLAPAPMAKVPATTPVVTPVNVPTNGFLPVLINCGGQAFTDSQNRKWSADKFFVGGSVSGTKLDIANTLDQQLYNSERYNETTYSIPTPSGSYRVILHLCEI